MTSPTTLGRPAGRWPIVAVAAIGVGLVLAPVAFRMFERAPKGADMLDGFGPYMSLEEIESFRTHLDTIGAARAETRDLVAGRGGELPALRAFDAQWDAIDEDMRSMLTSMEANLEEYEGIAALPPFDLFPWFFVAPGLLLVAAAGWAARRPAPGPRLAISVLAVGLIAAPFAFQLFTRGPGGARMIADFEPMMTAEQVGVVQGYFLTIGAAEGEYRQVVLPSAPPGALPAVDALVDGWQVMASDMAPMIGAMVDNLENYLAVAALPPFGLFPWFFVAPGVLVLGLLVADQRSARPSVVAAGHAVLEGATT